jgi:hypothetical protein
VTSDVLAAAIAGYAGLRISEFALNIISDARGVPTPTWSSLWRSVSVAVVVCIYSVLGLGLPWVNPVMLPAVGLALFLVRVDDYLLVRSDESVRNIVRRR